MFPQLGLKKDEILDYDLPDMADFPGVEVTEKLIGDELDKKDTAKYGLNKAKVFPTAEYIKQMIDFFNGLPVEATAQEKAGWKAGYALVYGKIYKKVSPQKGSKKTSGESQYGESETRLEYVVPREQLHRLLCFVHKAANHGGRDATTTVMRNGKLFGPAKDFINQWRVSCPLCQKKSPKAMNQRGPRAERMAAESERPENPRPPRANRRRPIQPTNTETIDLRSRVQPSQPALDAQVIPDTVFAQPLEEQLPNQENADTLFDLTPEQIAEFFETGNEDILDANQSAPNPIEETGQPNEAPLLQPDLPAEQTALGDNTSSSQPDLLTAAAEHLTPSESRWRLMPREPAAQEQGSFDPGAFFRTAFPPFAPNHDIGMGAQFVGPYSLSFADPHTINPPVSHIDPALLMDHDPSSADNSSTTDDSTQQPSADVDELYTQNTDFLGGGVRDLPDNSSPTDDSIQDPSADVGELYTQNNDFVGGGLYDLPEFDLNKDPLWLFAIHHGELETI